MKRRVRPNIRIVSVLAACLLPFVAQAQNNTAAEFATDDFEIAFAANGTAAKLIERETGRNLLRWKAKIAEVTQTNGVCTKIAKLASRTDGKLAMTFGTLPGEAIVSVRKEPWGLVFTAERLTVPDVREFKFLLVYPTCRTYNGAMLNGMSDSESAVVLRAYELTTGMQNRGNTVLEALVDLKAHPSALPARAALAVAPRTKIRDRLKAMTADAGALSSRCGGAWSLDAEENRQSYLIGSVTRESAEDWIAFAELGGFGTISFYDWWKSLGHYETNPKYFPEGDADLKETVDMIHAAGLKAGMHTLTACIDFQDPWVRPTCHSDMLVTHSYTLERPLLDGDSQLTVNEKPGPRHHLVTSFLSNGNILRIGGELMTYNGIKGDNPPYAFTGLKRGAYGTRRISGPIPPGTKVEYLFQHFFSLFPEPSSTFMDEMAAHLGRLYSRFGFDFVYHDGAEPMSAYNVALTRRKFASQIDQSRAPMQVEASIGGAHSWWFHSRLGAWDFPRWAVKRFHDYHIRQLKESVVSSEMLSAQAGWWSFPKSSEHVRGSFADEAEYFASHNAAEDFPMSVCSIPVQKGPPGFTVKRQMAILGRYERFRLAKAFTAKAKAYMGGERAEVRLMQDARGTWQLHRVDTMTHRISSEDFRQWPFVARSAGKGSLRVEALYGAQDGGEILVDATDASKMGIKTADSVTAEISEAPTAEHGPAIKIAAKNASSSRRGAWAEAERTYPHPYRNISAAGGKAFEFYVKGDGSGAVLNFRVVSPRIFNAGRSDHYVTLDFKGWRKVRFFLRERDAARYSDYVWQGYVPTYPLYRDLFMPERTEKVVLALNDIPAGGSCEVFVSPVKILRETAASVEKASVVINGASLKLPFALSSGEFAELENRRWTKYSADGEPLAAAAGPALSFAEGTNACAFAASSPDTRAEVTLFARSAPVQAICDIPSLPAAARRTLSYEALDPVMYAPSAGFDRPFAIVMRPGESARLELEIAGSVKRPVLSLRSAGDYPPLSIALPVELEAGERFICRDSRTWKVVKDFKTVRKGTLDRPLPILSGCWRADLGSDDPANARAQIELVKRYIQK